MIDPPEENYAPEAPTAEELARQRKSFTWRDVRDLSLVALGLASLIVGLIHGDSWLTIMGGALMAMPGFGSIAAATHMPKEDEDGQG